MANNQFKPFATSNNANVTAQSDFENLPALTSGFQSGKASSAQINKVLRQTSAISSAVAQVVADTTSIDVLDSGDQGSLVVLLKQALSGKLINVQVFTQSGAYTPSAGTVSIIVEALGGGGGSGGVPATTSSQSGISAPGTSGSYAKARYTSSFTGAQVIIGAGGSAGSATVSAGDGSATTFGTLLSCPGGKGSGIGVVSNGPAVAPAPNQSASPTGSNIIRASSGVAVNNAIQAAVGVATGWYSAPSGDGTSSSGVGASGRYNPPNNAALSGYSGTSGVVIIWEYN